MKLLTQKQTDKIFSIFSSVDSNGYYVDRKGFNIAVNWMLSDPATIAIMKSKLLKLKK